MNGTGADTKKVFIKTYGCQMNVYDAERMADILATEGLRETKAHGGGGSRHPQHLPHPREGRREGLFRARPRARVEAGAAARGQGPGGGGGRLRRAGRGQGDPAPGARRRRGGGPAELSPPARALLRSRAAERVVDTEFPVEDKFDRLPRPRQARTRAGAASGLPDDPGGLRQVLHLLRRALYPRRRDLPPGREDLDEASPRRGRRARADAHRPERERLSRRGPGRAPSGPWGASCCIASPRSPGSRACATRRAIRATWTRS